MVVRWFPASFHEKRLNVGRALLLLAALLISSVGEMAALDPSHRISQYAHTSWRVQDGYFGGQPVSITQTTDGYIWVGTAAGVFRCDGVQFVPWTSLSDEKLPTNDVHVVFGASEGSLWIATGDGLVQWAGQRSARYLKGADVNAVLQDKEGAIWVTKDEAGVHSQPLCRINGTDVRCLG